MKTSIAAIRDIASRHEADPAEVGRTCQACGRPWPCDVRRIALALALDGRTMQPTTKGSSPPPRVATAIPAAPGRVASPRRRQAAVADHRRAAFPAGNQGGVR
jgi:hypothetical protein